MHTLKSSGSPAGWKDGMSSAVLQFVLLKGGSCLLCLTHASPSLLFAVNFATGKLLKSQASSPTPPQLPDPQDPLSIFKLNDLGICL